jgi:hypothetical protein
MLCDVGYTLASYRRVSGLGEELASGREALSRGELLSAD